MKLGRLCIPALLLAAVCCYSQSGASPAVASPAPASPQGAPSPAAGTNSDSYVIGASDVLTVTVWNQPTLSGTILVRPDGMITVALIGDVQASGMTPLQLANQIATELKKYYTDPNVSVVISQIHSKLVYLLGEVEKKGPVDMTPGMTLLNAIAYAGGLTDYANTKRMYILRGETGKQQKIPVRYKDALKGISECNLILEPGDTIVVP